MKVIMNRSFGIDVACCAGVLALVLGTTGCAGDAHASVQADEAVPPFEQRGNDLVVPERSPLRGRLIIEPVAPKRVRHELDVPATAEADPAKVAKISPPLQGRVVKLMVRLGDGIDKGSPLYAFDSADLAAAQSDYLKAKSAEAQTVRALNRQSDLTEHGIGAKKDLEQAQTEEDQAKSELARATTSLAPKVR
jgi:cobalt-zinc-cadmium efflux system membrane fusion protein